MKRSSAIVAAALAGLLFVTGDLVAQPPGEGINLSITAPIPSLPSVTLSISPPASTPARADAATSGCPQPCKMCVSEPKHTTKKIYAGKCEDYCLPCCSFLSLLQGRCLCEEGPCGQLKVRHRLIVKKVAGCDTKQCVPREVPVTGPGAACTADGITTPAPPTPPQPRKE